MDEEKNNFSEYTENIKNETKDTVNKVKESFKNSNFKDNSKETKGFIFDMFKRPFSKVNEILDFESIKDFTIALILVLISTVAIFVENFNNLSLGFKYLFSDLLSPIIYVLVPAIVLLVCAKSNRKKLTTLISAFASAYSVYTIYHVICILNLFAFKIGIITYPLGIVAFAFYSLISYKITNKLIDDESSAVKIYFIMMAILGIVLYIF